MNIKYIKVLSSRLWTDFFVISLLFSFIELMSDRMFPKTSRRSIAIVSTLNARKPRLPSADGRRKGKNTSTELQREQDVLLVLSISYPLASINSYKNLNYILMIIRKILIIDNDNLILYLISKMFP